MAGIVALDVGTVRIGVAAANAIVRIAHPLMTIPNDESIFERLQQIARDEDAAVFAVGLPRGLEGQSTGQTQYVKDFVAELHKHLDVKIIWQDEAVTSRQAEEELKSRGKPYAKGAIDALAATYILEDYLREHTGEDQ